MNWPNGITLLRILLIPAILYFVLMPGPSHKLIALLLFALAAITDAIDGYVARRQQDETNLGKFADPIADKILIISVLLAFVQLQEISAVPVIIIIAREFLVSGLRTVIGTQGVVLGASLWGKLKTLSQIGLVFVLLSQGAFRWDADGVKSVVIPIVVAVTVISGIEYFYRFRKLLRRIS
ncbi:CDP-diacylglycerol--glycerol-3-phosphate 3-phosphatidyltransferase [bacterium HR07]|uniref:CDP-diacylglycerol--glycerol-3-phosphate 3-phosphatidyltransferase n=2 Tax=Candidatus Bipolaricaulota TaxID=67810 RepID=H5SF48_9BACT|nr:CDP-diacylglycerol--glycerol-3-phosphate 3-phosphatidyltransferase [uncultured Acetothermia bacterium]BAL59863.1 CDP-diacylglycerol--glycerol-3-phosphate 3-phosphatidyltransferase [Candidatus Acetothermum autotrophicum]GBC76295.1 CDP-diacylglycerol--glycerol-3-phosphate 3-phosphatidyltransferase [bacterium HR07]